MSDFEKRPDYCPIRASYYKLVIVGVESSGMSFDVGSGAGAVPQGLAYPWTPRFLWECLTSRTVDPFPAPASSNAACGLPALRFPDGFTSRVMRPIVLAALSLPGCDEDRNHRIGPAFRTAKSYSTCSSRSPDAFWPASWRA